MLKMYVYSVLAIVAGVSLFGYALPALISAKSTELVLLGAFILLVIPVAFYLIVGKVNK